MDYTQIYLIYTVERKLLIFVFFIKLAVSVQENIKIVRLKLNELEHEINFIADVIVLLLPRPAESIKEARNEISVFGRVGERQMFTFRTLKLHKYGWEIISKHAGGGSNTLGTTNLKCLSIHEQEFKNITENEC